MAAQHLLALFLQPLAVVVAVLPELLPVSPAGQVVARTARAPLVPALAARAATAAQQTHSLAAVAVVNLLLAGPVLATTLRVLVARVARVVRGTA
jgi:hypothetical protein